MAAEIDKKKSPLKEGRPKKKKERKLHDFGLKKITTAQLLEVNKKEIKRLKFRIGELTSENDELQHELDSIRKKEISAFKSELAKKDSIYIELKGKIKDLEKKLSTYKKTNDSLIYQLTQEKQKNQKIVNQLKESLKESLEKEMKRLGIENDNES